MHERPDGEVRCTRRDLLKAGTVGLSALGLLGRNLSGSIPALGEELADESERVAAFPQKRPLIVHTNRPPQLETPFRVFDEGAFTPNDAFFVRWHVAGIPTTIDPESFRLTIHGLVKTPLSLSLTELRESFDPVQVAAVCQCSGNGRSYFKPRVAGGQWRNGAMGNAVWTGVRLRDLLEQAGVQREAAQVRFDGADRPVLSGTPDFLKSLDLQDALQDSVLVAYAMNGEPLPWLNGYPLRLVVPGWYATYWIKMLCDIEVLRNRDQGYWMTKAYRLPDDPCGCVPPGKEADQTVPMGRMTVRSFITNPIDGQRISPKRPMIVRGIAFDQGYGIERVLFSVDRGRTWTVTALGADYGPFSFRVWEATFSPEAGRSYDLQSLAVNGIGESQRMTPRWNPGGYLRNVVETVRVWVG